MSEGQKLLELARTRIGEKYVNVLVPKNNPNWHGPWDCAEYMSWLVYQVGGFLYGCVDNKGDPALTEAYTGAWRADSKKLGQRVSVDLAASTPGGILLRYPPAAGQMGHIVVSDGRGGTVEAMGKAYGVVAGKVQKRLWDTEVFIPGFTYDQGNPGDVDTSGPSILYAMGREGMKKSVITDIQRALKSAGFDPGPINGDFGSLTVAAVVTYQTVKGLVVDGQVGRQTARRLGLTLS